MRRLMGSVLTVVLLAGCGGNPAPADPTTAPAPQAPPSSSAPPVVEVPHTLVFSATGTAPVTSVEVEIDGRKSTEKPGELPWRKVVEIPADGRLHEWRVVLTHGGGKVEMVAIFDGEVTGQTSGQLSGGGSGTGTASVSGSVRG